MLDLGRIMVEEEYYKDRVRQLEQDSLVRTIAPSDQEQDKFYYRFLASVSVLFVSLGIL